MGMKLSTTYIFVSDMETSLQFYRSLLQQEPLYANDDRWVCFDCGNMLALYNKRYDVELLSRLEGEQHFNKAYINDFYQEEEEKRNNIVIFNFEVDDLKKEYERIGKLHLGKVSELMYVNVHMPYWYFNVIDPDGNVLEISGCYHEGEG